MKMMQTANEPVADDRDTGFQVDSDQKADWAMRKIREARNEVERWKRYYDEQFQAVKRQAEADEAYFTALLEAYFDTRPHRATKTQESYSLPTGKLIRKAQQPEFDLQSEELVPWLKENRPEYVVEKPSVNWAALKRRLSVAPGGCAVETDTGEVIPGVAVTLREPKFCVQLASEGKEAGENE